MNLILASASKARSQLLQNLNISHEIIKSNIDEVVLPGLDVKNNSLRLAELKANSVARKINLSIKLLEELQNKKALEMGSDPLSGRQLPFQSLSDQLDDKKKDKDKK